MATITNISATDLVSASRAVINTNFANLNTDKLEAGDTVSITGIYTFIGTINVDDDAFLIRDNADVTKLIAFQASSVGAGNTRVITMPDEDITLISASSTETMTNKTFDSFTNMIHADDTHQQVRNTSGGTLAYGTPVYISGYNVGQDLPLVAAADANAAGTIPAIGFITEDGGLDNNSNGQVLVSGRLVGTASNNVDTSAFSVNDTVYLSDTAGEITTRSVAATSEVQGLGIVLRSHATLGVIQVVGAGRTNDIPNKMLSDRFRIADSGDDTKLIDVDASGISAATTRTLTFPDNDVDLGDITGIKQHAFTADVALSDTSETTIFTTSVAANDLGTTNLIQGKIFVSAFTHGVGGNFIIKLKYGSTTIATITEAVVGTATLKGMIDFTLHASGATNSQEGVINFTAMEQGIFVTAATGDWISSLALGTAAEDSTGALNLVITAQFDSNLSAFTAANGYATLIKS